MKSRDNEDMALLEDDDHPGWLTTYADLMTLLLVFFVLLYSLSSLNMKRFREAITSIQMSLGEVDPAIAIRGLPGDTGLFDKKRKLEDLIGLRSRNTEVLKKIINFIEHKKLGEHIDAYFFQGKIIIQVRGKVLFKSGSARLNEEGKPVLDEIINILSGFSEYDINIKGHTDNVPISTRDFPSNWELSAIRATTVLRYLLAGKIDPARLTATGFADLLPLAPNDSSKNRALNRRVEFVLEKKTD